MRRKRLKRELIAIVWTLLVTYAIGKWSFHLAYIERGYEAVGGEYLLIPAVYWGAWKAINYLFDSTQTIRIYVQGLLQRVLQRPWIRYTGAYWIGRERNDRSW